MKVDRENLYKGVIMRNRFIKRKLGDQGIM